MTLFVFFVFFNVEIPKTLHLYLRMHVKPGGTVTRPQRGGGRLFSKESNTMEEESLLIIDVCCNTAQERAELSDL